MADDTNTNPFLCDDEDFIENSVEEPTESKSNINEPTEPSFDSIAAKLLKDHLFLTALELHTELVETGRELPRLRDYFSNPGNFERTREDSPPTNLARTSSIQTFDSLDFARYSDDGERQVDERVAVLEFELRKAQETIKSLRASLTKEAETEHVTPEQTDESKTFPDDAIKPLETKALNFLVNQYLLQINSKLTSVTFSEENEEQDFESWDDVGLNIAQPPDLLHLYRDYSSHVTPTSDQCDGGCQTELEIHDITSLEKELESFKIEMEKRVLELEEKLINKDKEMLIRRGVAEGSEADDPLTGCPHENQSMSDQIPFQQYTGNQSLDRGHHGNDPDDGISEDDSVDDGDDSGSCSDSDLDLEPDCNCDHDKNETCPVCVRVQSPEVYRLDFTGEHSGDQDTLDSGSNNGEVRVTVGEEVNNNGCETEDGTQSDRTFSENQDTDISIGDTVDGVNNLLDNETDSQTIHKVNTDIDAEKLPQGPKIVISDMDADKQKSKENKTSKTDNVKLSTGEKGSKQVVKKDTKAVRRKEKTPKHSKRKGRISTEGDSKDLKEETKEIAEEKKEDLTETNRRMSKAFMKALKDVCFYVTKDNRIVSEVSKISDADQQKVVLMLGRCLPHIVPNVLLAKREELIPLILCTAMLHPDAKERDNLLNILFNLIKKPDEEQRQIILTGCVAFAQHVGPRRLEEELLPQCWEQISHKYMERRLLVAEACGGLAAYLPNEIRSSLVLSMLQQMLHDDKEADVREAVVRSLGLLMGFISDPDKYQQGCDLLKTALLDNSERVVTSAQQILLPSFAVWAHELGRLEHSLLHTILRDLEELAAIASQKTTTLNEGRFLLYVSTLTELVSFLYVSVIESGPYMDKLDHVMAKTEDLIASKFPNPSSTLTDLSTICGDKLRLAAIVSLFEDHISQEWFEPWDSLNWVVNNLIPRLLEVVMGSALSFPRIVSSLARCFYKICRIFGKTFVDKKVKPRFIDVLLMGEEHMDPQSNFTSNTTPLTTCVVPVYASGVLSAFNTEEDRMQLSQFLREALFCLSIYQSPKDSLRIAVTELCSCPNNHELLLNVLWEGVVHTSAQVRATAARMFEIVMHGISEVLVSTRVIPALVTLGNDPEISVRIATIPALGTIIESISSREMLDRVYMQLQTFLDDPQYREEHSLHVELIATFARVGPNAEPKFRDEFILPRLTTLAIENNNESNESKKKEIALQLFEAYSALSCCFVNYQLVQEVMLPGLRCLKHDMALIAPEHEEVVSSMIKEYESKIETSRPADRSSSVLGSFGTPTGGEDVKARMMNRLKESTAKANISSLFNRKK